MHISWHMHQTWNTCVYYVLRMKSEEKGRRMSFKSQNFRKVSVTSSAPTFCALGCYQMSCLLVGNLKNGYKYLYKSKDLLWFCLPRVIPIHSQLCNCTHLFRAVIYTMSGEVLISLSCHHSERLFKSVQCKAICVGS